MSSLVFLYVFATGFLDFEVEKQVTGLGTFKIVDALLSLLPMGQKQVVSTGKSMLFRSAADGLGDWIMAANFQAFS